MKEAEELKTPNEMEEKEHRGPSYHRLPSSVKAFIIQRLACYESAPEVRDAVKEEFGLDIPLSYIHRHDPTKPYHPEGFLDKKWIELFEKTREEFQRGLYDTGIVWKAYRLKRLDEMERRLRREGKYMEAAQLLEQAAKEVGGAFEQRRRDSAITLETLQKAIDELAQAVVAEVADEEMLRRIEERWGRTMVGAETQKKEYEWGW